MYVQDTPEEIIQRKRENSMLRLNFLSKMKTDDYGNLMNLEFDHIRNACSEEFSVTTSCAGILEMVQGVSPMVNTYLLKQDYHNVAAYVPGMPTKNWEEFKWCFLVSEIQSMVTLLPVAQRDYFKKTSGFGPLCVVGQKVFSLLTLFNVEALILLTRFPQRLSIRRQDDFCNCCFNLNEMPKVPIHECRICGGQSVVDEQLLGLPMQVRRYVASEHIKIFPHSLVVTNYQSIFYAKRCRDPGEFSTFIMNIIAGNEPDIECRIGMDIRQECQNQSSHDIYDFSVIDRNVVISRASIKDNVIEEICTYESSSGIIRRISHSHDHYVVFPQRAIVLDPEGESYRGLIQDKQQGGHLMPKYTHLNPWGFSDNGIVHTGTPMEQLSKEVKRLYGVTVPIITTFGVFYRNGLMKSMSALKPNGSIMLPEREIRCSVCDIEVSGENCRYSVTARYGNYASLCSKCVKLSLLYLNQKWIKLYDKLQLYDLMHIDVVQDGDTWVPSSEFYELCRSVRYLDALPRYSFPSRQLCISFILGFQFDRLVKLVHRRRIIVEDYFLMHRLLFLASLRKFVRGFRQCGTVGAVHETLSDHIYPYREMYFINFSPTQEETSDRYLRPDGGCNYYRFFRKLMNGKIFRYDGVEEFIQMEICAQEFYPDYGLFPKQKDPDKLKPIDCKIGIGLYGYDWYPPDQLPYLEVRPLTKKKIDQEGDEEG